MSPEVVVETQRLVLRTEAPGDQAIWFAHMNDAQVLDHLGGPVSAEQIAKSFARMADAYTKGEPTFFLVTLRSDGMLIGKCGLALIDTPGVPSALTGQIQIGWTLRADQWGRGYAREAAEAALALAFERHGASIVYSQTSERNVPSWRLMERLGLVRRADLDYVDPAFAPRDNPTILYAIDRAAWRTRKEPIAP